MKRKAQGSRGKAQGKNSETDLPLDKYPPPTPEMVRAIMGEPLPPLTEEQKLLMKDKVITGNKFLKWMEEEDRRFARKQLQRAKELAEIERWLKRTRREKFDPAQYVQGEFFRMENDE